MVLRVPGGLAKLVDNQLRGRVGRIAHAQVDDIGALLPLGELQRIELSKQIRGQTCNSGCRFDPVLGVAVALHRSTCSFQMGPAPPGCRFYGGPMAHAITGHCSIRSAICKTSRPDSRPVFRKFSRCPVFGGSHPRLLPMHAGEDEQRVLCCIARWGSLAGQEMGNPLGEYHLYRCNLRAPRDGRR